MTNRKLCRGARRTCDLPARKRGLCEGHYKRLIEGRSIATPLHRHAWRDRPRRLCSVEGCVDPHEAHGLCHAHNYRRMKGLPMDHPRRVRTNSSGICEMGGCAGRVVGRGRCQAHYRKLTGTMVRSNQLRRARKERTTSAPFSTADWELKVSMWGGRCWICRRDTRASGPLQMDHVKPLSKGGPHVLANLRPACGECNNRKGKIWPLSKVLVVRIRILRDAHS